jgi:hypothetical protein
VTALERDQSSKQSDEQLGHKSASPLQRMFLRVLVALLVLVGITYCADYALFQYRLTTKHQPFDSVTVQHFDAVAHKDGKEELIFEPPTQQTCVNSLFPHAGDVPCWYLKRHTQQETDI